MKLLHAALGLFLLTASATLGFGTTSAFAAPTVPTQTFKQKKPLPSELEEGAPLNLALKFAQVIQADAKTKCGFDGFKSIMTPKRLKECMVNNNFESYRNSGAYMNLQKSDLTNLEYDAPIVTNDYVKFGVTFKNEFNRVYGVDFYIKKIDGKWIICDRTEFPTKL